MDGITTVVLDKAKRKVLLIKRRDVPIWVLPGGGIEQNESQKQAAIRETLEETGFLVKIKRKVAEYSYIDSRQKNHLYLCEIISGKATTGPETKDINFFHIKALPKPHHPYTTDWLNDALGQKHKTIKKYIKPISNKAILSQLFKYPIPVIRYFLAKAGLRINT